MTYFTDTLKLITLQPELKQQLLWSFSRKASSYSQTRRRVASTGPEQRCNIFACAVPVGNSCVDLECFPPAQVLKIAQRSQKKLNKKITGGYPARLQQFCANVPLGGVAHKIHACSCWLSRFMLIKMWPFFMMKIHYLIIKGIPNTYDFFLCKTQKIRYLKKYCHTIKDWTPLTAETFFKITLCSAEGIT